MNLYRLLGFLVNQAGDSQARRMLLSTTQIITSSGVALRGRDSRTKFPIIAIILLMPIIATGVLLYDWIYFVNRAMHGVDTHFLDEPEFYGEFLAIIVMIVELLIYADILLLLSKLFRLHTKIANPERKRLL